MEYLVEANSKLTQKTVLWGSTIQVIATVPVKPSHHPPQTHHVSRLGKRIEFELLHACP